MEEFIPGAETMCQLLGSYDENICEFLHACCYYEDGNCHAHDGNDYCELGEEDANDICYAIEFDEETCNMFDPCCIMSEIERTSALGTTTSEFRCVRNEEEECYLPTDNLEAEAYR